MIKHLTRNLARFFRITDISKAATFPTSGCNAPRCADCLKCANVKVDEIGIIAATRGSWDASLQLARIVWTTIESKNNNSKIFYKNNLKTML